VEAKKATTLMVNQSETKGLVTLNHLFQRTLMTTEAKPKLTKAKEDSILTQMIEDADDDFDMFDDCSSMDYDIEYTTEY
tara:strand:- start:294 stop:530 length:237 start_codon:yes stop_codon:yes gene_type:complete